MEAKLQDFFISRYFNCVSKLNGTSGPATIFQVPFRLLQLVLNVRHTFFGRFINQAILKFKMHSLVTIC